MKPCCTRPLSLPVHPVRAYRRFLLFGTTILILLGLCGVESPAHAASSSIQKIVAGGDPTPLGGVFASDGTPALSLGIATSSGSKSVAFFGHIEEGSAPKGIFLATSGTITSVVAIGEPTPLGGTYQILSPPAQNQAGEVAFSAMIKDGDADQGVFLASEGHVTAITDFAEGGSLKEYASSPLTPAVNNRGEVAFRAIHSDEAEDLPGIFLASSTAILPLVADNDGIPALAPEARLLIDTYDFFPPSLNDAGETVLAVQVKNGVPGIFVASREGQIRQIVVVGDPTPIGGTFTALTRPALNNAGQVAFSASIANGASPHGLFLASSNKIERVVLEGDPAPDGGTLSLIGAGLPLAINDRGDVAFGAFIKHDDRQEGMGPQSGVFVSSHGQIAKAVAMGDPSPLGGTFLQAPVAFQLHDTGTVLFTNIVDTDGDGNPDNQGIFSVTPSF